MSQTPQPATSWLARPWTQLFIGVICMACVANLQYGWTQFVNPIEARHHWGLSKIQIAFSLFVLVETWLIPVEGYLVDRYGPRWVVLGGAVLVASAWVINSVAGSLQLLYVGAVIGGIGTGCVYGTCVGNALKWFYQRRGLAAGITAAGFGAGAALTVIPIGNMIRSSGYEQAFLFFGLLQGAIVFVMAWGLRVAPKRPAAAKVSATQSARDYRPTEVLRKPVFWVLYVMFVLVASGGLMMTASLGPIAKDFRLSDSLVTLAGFSLPALAFALSLDRILDGLGRPFFGWISDLIGRENTMCIAFVTGALALFVLSKFGTSPVVFVLLSALYFGVFGEIYSLFPATQGDTFGARFAASNAGILYTAKGTAALMVPLAAYVANLWGWQAVFSVAMTFNLIAAALAMLVLKPLRAKHLAASRTEPEVAAESRSPLAARGA